MAATETMLAEVEQLQKCLQHNGAGQFFCIAENCPLTGQYVCFQCVSLHTIGGLISYQEIIKTLQDEWNLMISKWDGLIQAKQAFDVSYRPLVVLLDSQFKSQGLSYDDNDTKDIITDFDKVGIASSAAKVLYETKIKELIAKKLIKELLAEKEKLAEFNQTLAKLEYLKDFNIELLYKSFKPAIDKATLPLGTQGLSEQNLRDFFALKVKAIKESISILDQNQ
jgi:hypothetical protein